MDIFNFCWMTLFDESKKCGVIFSKDTCDVKNDIDQNFDKPIKRISYLYKYGSYNISFFHQCFKEFVTKASDSSKLIENLRSMKNLNICSMSAGPGTDIIGLLYSLYSINKPLVNAATFNVISKFASWSNIVNDMINSSIISVPDESSCKLFTCDILKDLTRKTCSSLKKADILLMCDSFSSSHISEKVINDTLKRIIQVLKPGAVVFFIANKENSAYLGELDSSSSFLYGPIEVTLENMPYNEKIIELVGVKPVCSGTSVFAVWQKLYELKCETNLQNVTDNNLTISSNQQSSANMIACKSGTKAINPPGFHMSSLKRELSSESIASSSQFSSSRISSQIMKTKDNPAISADSIRQNIDFSENFFNNSTKNTLETPSNTSNLVIGKNYVSLGENSQKSVENYENIGSLIKSLESLITKLERLTVIEDSLKKSYNEEEQSSHSKHHQNMHQACCGSSVRPCQFAKNNFTCCHSIICNNNTNADNYSGSMNVTNNSHIMSQGSPCIVIPIQNLSNESMKQILSIISQNISSANKTTSNLLPKEDN